MRGGVEFSFNIDSPYCVGAKKKSPRRQARGLFNFEVLQVNKGLIICHNEDQIVLKNHLKCL
jgi:hypothetical protein